MIYDLPFIAEAIGYIAIGASVDVWGVPQLGRITIVDILAEQEEILFYDTDRVGLLENVAHNPKMSLSITNVKTFNGRQVKGLVEKVDSLRPVTEVGKVRYAEALKKGIESFAKMRIAEIYDVIQKEKPLREAEWKGKAFAEYDKLRIEYPLFSPTALEPQNMPEFQHRFGPFFTALFTLRIPGYVGTVELRGTPNISPRFIIAAESNFLLWGDRFKNKTFFNFSRPSPITVFTPNPETGDAFIFKGWAKFHFFGKTVVKVNEAWHQIGFKDPMQAVHFYPEEIDVIAANKPPQRYFEARAREKWLPLPVFEAHAAQLGEAVESKAQLQSSSQSAIKHGAKVSVRTHLKAVMLSDEPLAMELIAPLRPEVEVLMLPIEKYDRTHLVKTDVVMSIFGNRATEVDLFYLRSLLDAATFYSETDLGRIAVRFLIFIASFEKSPSLKAMMNALETYIKTLNQVGRTKIELMFVWLPHHFQAQAFQAEVRRRVTNLLITDEFGELNYLRLPESTVQV